LRRPDLPDDQIKPSHALRRGKGGGRPVDTGKRETVSSKRKRTDTQRWKRGDTNIQKNWGNKPEKRENVVWRGAVIDAFIWKTRP